MHVANKMTPAEELAQLLNGPAAKPPGDEMALDPNATGEGTTMAVVVSVIMMVITGGCAILRAYSRLVVTKTARIEDILGFIALVCTLQHLDSSPFFVYVLTSPRVSTAGSYGWSLGSPRWTSTSTTSGTLPFENSATFST